MVKYISVLGSIVMLLAGCQSGTPPNIDDDFGNAVRQNSALQTLNPDAGGPDDSASLDGPGTAQALDRMRTRSNQAQTGTLIQDVGN